MHDNTTPLADGQPDLTKFGKHYDEKTFWSKVASLPRGAVVQVMEKALVARELLFDGGTPIWAKAVLAGALGYLILPIDAIPDITPFFGFADDASMLALVLANLDWLATDEVKARARQRLPKSLRGDD